MKKTFRLLPIKSKKINKPKEKISLIDRHKNNKEVVKWRICIEHPFINCDKINILQQKKVSELIDDFSKDNNVLKIIIFGSSVTNKCHVNSDVDIFILLKENKKLVSAYHNFVFDLWTNYTVDHRLLNEIIKTGVIVYDRNITR